MNMKRTVIALVAVVAVVASLAAWRPAWRPAPRPAAPAAAAPATAYLQGSFFQPGSGGGNADTWTQTRYNTELQQMNAVKMRDVIIQWTINGQTSYYPSSNTYYAMRSDMVGKTIAANAANGGQGKIWLGLALPLYWDWYVNSSDAAWVNNLLAQQKAIATELAQKYPGKIAGLYIPQETDDALLVDATKTANARTYYNGLVAHVHSLGLKVMTSPFYAGKRLTPSAWGAAVKSLWGNTHIDILNMQDGGGNADMTDAQVVQYFSATKTALAGTGIALWVDHDMYEGSNPAPPVELQNRIKAVAPYVTGITGFQFMTHMGPTDLGTSTYYNAYKTYVLGG